MRVGEVGERAFPPPNLQVAVLKGGIGEAMAKRKERGYVPTVKPTVSYKQPFRVVHLQVPPPAVRARKASRVDRPRSRGPREPGVIEA